MLCSLSPPSLSLPLSLFFFFSLYQSFPFSLSLYLSYPHYLSSFSFTYSFFFFVRNSINDFQLRKFFLFYFFFLPFSFFKSFPIVSMILYLKEERRKKHLFRFVWLFKFFLSFFLSYFFFKRTKNKNKKKIYINKINSNKISIAFVQKLFSDPLKLNLRQDFHGKLAKIFQW